ncbi:MAG: peptide-methionine (S)-S-oxide reductase MsrA [Verrucomicrobia bacterium]|nr:peptide-methionine (S)-S-oxide reductase MsrA [Verrucomicrobiota bacterium]
MFGASVLLFFGSLNVMNAAPDSTNSTPDSASTELATIGGGCFWCTEAVFETLDGVKSVISGYAGGKTENPTYQQISTGQSGHAEVIQIEFDPRKVSFEQLLNLFWNAHDPTTLNRQGADTGTQYRSTIMYHNDEQKTVAEKSKAAAQKDFKDPIVTEIVPLKKFYPAEEYHQDYFAKNPEKGYCTVVIRPKLLKLEKSNLIPSIKK